MLELDKSNKKELEKEYIPYDTRLKFTRLIRVKCQHENEIFTIYQQNRFINIANSVIGRQKYLLEAGPEGDYLRIEYAWHSSEIELIMFRPNTVKFVEIISDYISVNLLNENEVNEILKDGNLSFKFDKGKLIIKPIEELDELSDEEHPNIRKEIERMKLLHENKHYSGVLQAAANIYETLAKDILKSNDKIQDQTLRSFFDLYKKHSRIPKQILEYIEEIYNRRNKEPLAGHGSIKEPTVTKENSVVIIEMTKAIVKIERELSNPRIEHSAIK
ncbi:hypothetical protein NQS42_02080 [Bacillus sp. C10(2022)]|uniref:hypothetical protein n=1 Tax=Bacillus TaxID=1386 RepID=UPI000BA6BF63|nr:hypothetical protein [Bacillus licheniformis]MEC3833641.1 hypothetical protein [Bacillus licheniformis]PAE74128.1 hypothetical protein CHH84_02060 [Bacillus licheniformis]TWN27176.1 hypothetical protein CHCC14557_3777 [Bacillus licheniformis]